MGLLAGPHGMLNSPRAVKEKRAPVFHFYCVGKSCLSHQASHKTTTHGEARWASRENHDGKMESYGPQLPSSSLAMWSATSLITSFGLSSSSLKQSFQMAKCNSRHMFYPPKYKGIFNRSH